MKIIGIDFGDARVGIAESDISETVATAVGTLKVTGINEAVKKSAEKGKELSASLFVVGLPKNMSGEETHRAERTRRFASMLTEASGIECVFYDERLSTVAAYQYLNITDYKSRKRRDIIDALSAQIILQDYLDYKKQK